MRETITRVSSKSGKVHRRPARPRSSLIDKLSNLHLLLRVPSFARWPLEVRFFCEDVYKVWQRWNERVNGKIRDSVQIVLDVTQQADVPEGGQPPPSAQAKGKPNEETRGRGGIESVNVGYGGLKNHVEKSLRVLDDREAQFCAICAVRLGSPAGTALVCPKENCQTVSHMTCLAKRFLDEEGVPGSTVPISGSCPQCKSTLQWIDLVKEMSLRMRGKEEMARLMRKPTVRKRKVMKGAASLQADKTANEVEGDSDEEGDDDLAEDAMHPVYETEEPLPADWYHQADGEEDVMSMTSADSDFSNHMDAAGPPTSKLPAQRLEVVIEDSNWTNAEILD